MTATPLLVLDVVGLTEKAGTLSSTGPQFPPFDQFGVPSCLRSCRA